MFRLESDFDDFYDDISDDNSKIVYYRIRENISRVDDLNFLKSLGIKTVNFGPFKKFGQDTKQFVVYTNQFLHDSLGKHIYTFDEVSVVCGNATECTHKNLRYKRIGHFACNICTLYTFANICIIFFQKIF